MSDNSAIEWLNKPGYRPATLNPTVGCNRVSPGCDNCYPIPIARIRESNPHPKVATAYAGVVEHTGTRLDWTGQVNILPDRLGQPLKWRDPRMIFIDSMSDLFHSAIPDEYIARVFAMMARTPRHLYLILTKRHARMRSLLNSPNWRGSVAGFVRAAQPGQSLDAFDAFTLSFVQTGVLPHVWLGVSVEDQQRADLRIPALLDTPTAVHWISAEPLLGKVVLRDEWLTADPWSTDSALDWVVAGGESGPKTRPMHADWPRSLRDQCVRAGVPFFMKQAGAVLAKEWGCSDPKGHNPAEWPEPFSREYPDA